MRPPSRAIEPEFVRHLLGIDFDVLALAAVVFL
jgi:hypothetical protein